MPRTPKTPRQRAEEALGIEDRRVKKLTGQRDEASTRLAGLERDLIASTARRDHLAGSPDLPQSRPPATSRTRGPRGQVDPPKPSTEPPA